MKIPDESLSLGQTAAVSECIREGAIRWLLWLRSGGGTPSDLDAFRRWRAKSDEHARVAQDLIWIWNMLGLLADLDCRGCVERLDRQNFPANIRNRSDSVH